VSEDGSTAGPWLTRALPGCGGQLRSSPADFEVEEIPAYLPCGSGEHVYLWIEKTDLTTPEAIRRLSRALGVDPGGCGSAGLKDRHARTRQWLSFPRPTTPELAQALNVDGVKVLRATRHHNKLKTGHLRGNRFRLVIRGVDGGAALAAERARSVLAVLSRPPGMPNWYGAQRFGIHGDNALRGAALLRGERITPPPRDGREKRFLLSAWQSSLFNRVLAERLTRGELAQVVPGDLLQVVASGGLFASEAPELERERIREGEIVPTGPMFGARMPRPKPGSEAAAREEAILAAEHLSESMLGARHDLVSGTRRALCVRVGEPTVETVAEDAISITFSLPSGSYATVVAAEVMKSSASLEANHVSD
jgi:tRNA pseudouridine13 synthase